MLSLLVLDCDGVILESMDIKTEAMRRVGQNFGQELCDRLVLFQRLEGGISRYEKFNWLWQEAYGRDISPEESHALEADFLGHMGDALTNCALVPGTLEVLDAWHTKLPIYVCSGAPDAELKHLLTQRGQGKYFTKICGYPPAKTALLQNILRESAVNPQSALMVGDTITDSRAAEHCGTQFFGIGSQFADSAHPHGPVMYALNLWLHNAFSP